MSHADRFLIGFLLITAGILAFILIIGGAAAKTLTVDGGGGGDYTTIQDAVDAAEDGDTILVSVGTYLENVEVDVIVTITGDGMEDTIIDGDDDGIGDDFPIEYGQAYYVYSISPFGTLFHIVGDCPVYDTFDLKECWNLIPWISMESIDVGIWAATVDSLAGYPFIQAVVKYDDSYDMGENQYITWYPGDPVNKFQMVPGEAFWVFAASDLSNIAYP